MSQRKTSLVELLAGTAIVAATAVGAYTIVKKVWDRNAQTPMDDDAAPAAEDKIIWIKKPEDVKAEEETAELQGDLDLDGDGKPDAALLDTDGDGHVDTVLADTDGDGEVDTALVDLDGDGSFDVAVTLDEAGTQE